MISTPVMASPVMAAITVLVMALVSVGFAAPAWAQTDTVGPDVLAGDGPRGRIISFILQAEPQSPTEVQLRGLIDGVVADIFGETDAFNPDNDEQLATEATQILERTRTSFPLVPGADPLLFRVFNMPVLVVPVAAPLPRDEFASSWQDRRQFPNAASVLTEHQAHTIVFALVDPAETAQQVRAAEAVSAVAAGFAAQGDNTLGVHWGEADMALPPATLTEAFNRAAVEAEQAQAEDQPIKPAWHRLLTHWINIRPASAGVFRNAYAQTPANPVPDTLADNDVGFATKGLEAFIGREIEMVPSGRPAPEQALVLVNLLAYLLDRGQVFQDNDTLGFTAERTIAANIVEQGSLPGMEDTPVLRLTYKVTEDNAGDEAALSEGAVAQ
ncbi:MAG: DUF4261 domain-containing protein [Pseudomonadota bacterium]